MGNGKLYWHWLWDHFFLYSTPMVLPDLPRVRLLPVTLFTKPALRSSGASRVLPSVLQQCLWTWVRLVFIKIMKYIVNLPHPYCRYTREVAEAGIARTNLVNGGLNPMFPVFSTRMARWTLGTHLESRVTSVLSPPSSWSRVRDLCWPLVFPFYESLADLLPPLNLPA